MVMMLFNCFNLMRLRNIYNNKYRYNTFYRVFFKNYTRNKKIEKVVTTLQPCQKTSRNYLIISDCKVVSRGTEKRLQPTYNHLQLLLKNKGVTTYFIGLIV